MHMHAPEGVPWHPRVVSSVKEELEIIAPSKLAIESVCKTFRGRRSGDVHALGKVSLKGGEGECVCLVGASGCGKSTPRNIIGRLAKPDGGGVLADGKEITAPG